MKNSFIKEADTKKMYMSKLQMIIFYMPRINEVEYNLY